MEIYAILVAALLYLGSAVAPALQRRTIAAATAIAWLLHGAALWGGMLMPHSLRLGFAMMLSAAMWLSVAVYWFENRNFSLDGLRVLVLPSAAVAMLLPAVFSGSIVSLEGKSILFPWHVAVAILAYSALTIAAFHAVLMALQESKLHTRTGLAQKGWFAGAIDRLPALLT